MAMETEERHGVPVRALYAVSYTHLYKRAVFELLERERGEGEAVLFARSATVGGQKVPAHWGGDLSLIHI